MISLQKVVENNRREIVTQTQQEITAVATLSAFKGNGSPFS